MTSARENCEIAVAMRACVGLAAVLLACSEAPQEGARGDRGGAANENYGGKGGSAGGARGGSAGVSSGGQANVNHGGASSEGGATAMGGADAAKGGTMSASGGAMGGSRGGVGGGNSALGGRSGTGGGDDGSRATGGVMGGAGAAGAANASILVPEKGVLLGQYYGDESISATTSKLGRTLPIHLTYYAWADEWTSGNTQSDLNAGRIPLVNWELFDVTLDDIIAGTHDAMIARRAKDAKALGKKFFLDFGAEMNGDWSPWSGAQNGSSAAKYLAAYRHTHDAMVAGGATNVVWVWCPNVTDEPNQSWNRALEYYPGDGYVDWTCVDGYNWGTSNDNGWQSFHDVFATIYAKLLTKNKPIMIGEMASAEVGGNKAAWISAMVPSLKADFPQIKALVWFDVNKETDWRISSSAQAESAFVQMVNDPYTNP